MREGVLMQAEIENIANQIYTWSKGSGRMLNVLTLPGNGTDFFHKTILESFKEGKEILYVSEESDILNFSFDIKGSLKICDMKTAWWQENYFDLVIYDEINNFPFYGNDLILKLFKERTKSGGKSIMYSVERMPHAEKEVIFPVKREQIPTAEPRSIITRININIDIPHNVYDYIKWSILNDRNVLVIVPDEEKIQMVYKYLYRYCNDICSGAVFSFAKSSEDGIKSICQVLKRRKTIVITDILQSPCHIADFTDIMVFFAESDRFTAKMLVHIAAAVACSNTSCTGEVIFLSNRNTNNIEKAKKIIRRFNKEAWESGLLKI